MRKQINTIALILGIAYNTNVKRFKIVIDTNVIISALRSRNGASFKLLSLLGKNRFDMVISVPLILEYESQLFNHLDSLVINEKDVQYFLDYICSIALKQDIFYLWRPFLKDPKDDFILELAFNSESDFVITYNKKDFLPSEQLGVTVLSPKEFLLKMKEIR